MTSTVPASMGEPLSEAEPDEVLVEGSWFKVEDLPQILGNYMRSTAEHHRQAKNLSILLTESRENAESWKERFEDVRAELHRQLEVRAKQRDAALAEARSEASAGAEARARVGVLEGQLATARALHQPVIGGVQIGRSVKQVKVCSSCPATQWPCEDAVALGMDGGGSDE